MNSASSFHEFEIVSGKNIDNDQEMIILLHKYSTQYHDSKFHKNILYFENIKAICLKD